MNRLAIHAQTLPEGWKWTALFTPPAGFDGEWRAWLAEAQRAEDAALLGWWAHRTRAGGDGAGREADAGTGDGEGGDLLAA